MVEREGSVPCIDRDREVESGDDTDDTKRVPGLRQAVAGALGRHGLAEELARLARGEVCDVDHLLHLAQCLAADLAHLGGFERRGLDPRTATDDRSKTVPLGHVAEHEIADAMAFLASDDARYIA